MGLQSFLGRVGDQGLACVDALVSPLCSRLSQRTTRDHFLDSTRDRSRESGR